jgi:hypothetical protein
MDNKDMQAVNLFGLPLDVYNRDSQRSSKDLQTAIADLVSQAMREDPHGISRDFTTRKAVATYDPYNEESQYAALRYEDETKLRASMIIDV